METNNKPPWTDRIFEDIGFHVRMRQSVYAAPSPHDTRTDRALVVDYEVREASVGYDIDDAKAERPIILYRRGSETNGETTDINESETWAHGQIKWDGCSHNHLPSYHHECSRQGMKNIGALYDHMFDMALEMMPGNEEYLR